MWGREPPSLLAEEDSCQPYMTNLAVLIACHNRREKTLECLHAVIEAARIAQVELAIFLVDDGSTDGTAAAACNLFPPTHVLTGSGGLFWNRAMAWAFSEAHKANYDFYFWLNDDTLLKPDCLARMMHTYADITQADQVDGNAIIVGTTAGRTGGTPTYGGLEMVSRWRPLSFRLVQPTDAARRCDTMNGNCVLVPRPVVDRIGILDATFAHAMGDIDYGLRARRAGVGVWISPGIVGYCDRNTTADTWQDMTLPLSARWRKLLQPKALPPRSWYALTRRHAGPLWPLYWVWPYLHVLLGGIWQHKARGATE